VVLLKELPDAVRGSAAAYIGCISGALLKDDYLKTIRDAGFSEVSVLDETFFPVDFITDDPMAKAVISKMKTTGEDAAEISVASIKVQGIKPK
jgi:hypothetical protein